MKNINKPNIMENKVYYTPIIFRKKKNQLRYKSLNYINSDTGKTRHYPPAAQE